MKPKDSRRTSTPQARAEYKALETEMFLWSTDWIKERYRYLRIPGAAEDCAHVLSREFRARANKLGLYLSDAVIDKKVTTWIDWWLNNPLKYNQMQRQCGHIRSLVVRRALQTLRQYRAHVLYSKGLTKTAIAKELGVTRRTIYSDLKCPLATVKLKRHRLAAVQRAHRPRPKPATDRQPAPQEKREICSPLVSSPTDDPRKNTANRNQISHVSPPPPDIDVLAELRKHWNQPQFAQKTQFA